VLLPLQQLLAVLLELPAASILLAAARLAGSVACGCGGGWEGRGMVRRQPT
jgi:hypothetical protein